MLTVIIDKSVLKGAKVVLFGAGGNGRYFLMKLREEGFSVAYFVDNGDKVKEAEGVPVYEPQRLLTEDRQNLK